MYRKEKTQVLLRSNLSLCLHVLNSSDLRFSVAPSGWKIMWYFSLSHSLHFLVDGLNSEPLVTIFQLMLNFFPLSLSFQKYDDNIVKQEEKKDGNLERHSLGRKAEKKCERRVYK